MYLYRKKIGQKVRKFELKWLKAIDYSYLHQC